MLPRSEFEMSENIRDFTVAFADSQLVGCGALHFYTPTSAEVRSLAVSEEHKQSGAGRAIASTPRMTRRLPRSTTGFGAAKVSAGEGTGRTSPSSGISRSRNAVKR